MGRLDGKVALITGAGGGMGRVAAERFAAEGAKVAVVDVDANQDVVDAITDAGGQAIAVAADVRSFDQVTAAVAATVSAFGGLHVLYNNAGVSLTVPLDAVKQSDFDWIMGINFWGVVYGTQAFLPHLKKSGDGHVINTSSLFGLMAVPTQGTYNATKFAVRGYTEALRMELELAGEPVSATCVHPGGIATNIAKAGKFDDSMERVAGVSIDKQRKMADKMISTTTAESAALQILKAVENNERRVLVGPDARILDKLVRLMGSAYQVLIVRRLRRMRTQ